MAAKFTGMVPASSELLGSARTRTATPARGGDGASVGAAGAGRVVGGPPSATARSTA